MFRKLRKFILIGFMVILQFVCKSIVFGADKSMDFDIKNLRTWSQGRFPESNTLRLAGGSGLTVSQAACGYFSVTYMLVKGGYINPKETTPIDIIIRANDLGMWDKGSDFHMDMSRISELEPDLEVVEMFKHLSGKNSEDFKEVRRLYDEGNYVLMDIGGGSTKGHYVFVDGFDGDDIIIGDSGGKTTSLKWSDLRGPSGDIIKYLMVFKSKSGRKCNERPSIYTDDIEKYVNKTPTNCDLFKDFVKQNGLPGMKNADGTINTVDSEAMEQKLLGGERSKIQKTQKELPTQTDLSTSERLALYKIQENMSYDSKELNSWVFFMGNVFSILLMMYGMLLIVAYLFDKSNTMFDISLVSILTVGRFKGIMQYDGDNEVSDRFLTVRMLLVFEIIIFVVAFIIISGLLYVWLFKFLEFLGKR